MDRNSNARTTFAGLIDSDLVEVVAEHNVLRDVLRDLSEQHGVSLAGDVGTIANRVISDATALAVESFANEKNAREERHRLEQFSFMMHDLKTPAGSTFRFFIPAKRDSTAA
jgi:hypothetical protein